MQPSNLPSLPPLGLTGPKPFCGLMVMPAIYPSCRGSLECYDRGEYQQCPLQKDPPIRGSPTSGLRLLGGLPRRTQQVSSFSDNVSAWVAIQWCDYTWKWINFPTRDLSQSTTKEQESKALSLGSGVSPSLAASPTRALPPKAEGQISMTMEVSKLLSRAALNTSGLASRSSTPKRPGSLALATPLPVKLGDSAKQVDASSQGSISDDAEMDDPTLKEIHASPSHLVKTPGPSSRSPSLDVTQLQEEANKALGHLLATRSSINTHWRKQLSDFGMVLCQNESEITVAIKEAKTLCACTIRDMEAHWAALISKAKIWHAACIKKAEANCAHTLTVAENHCSTAIRDVEFWGASQAHSIQQLHA